MDRYNDCRNMTIVVDWCNFLKNKGLFANEDSVWASEN